MKTLCILILSSVGLFAQSGGVGQIWTAPAGNLQSSATANGNGSTLAVQGLTSATFTVNCSVACSGGTTVTFQGSQDGTNYSALNALQAGTTTISSTVVNQGTTPTIWFANVAGLQTIRAVISSYSAGTITVTATAVGAGLSHLTVQALQSGTWSLAADQSVNMAQIGGAAVALGQTTMTASFPVTIASNQSVLEVGPTTSANSASNPFFYQLSNGTNTQTFNSTATSSKYGADFNLLSILGTAPTTAGAINIQGLSGGTNVPVSQATAASLNATVVGSGVFEVGPTTSANTVSNPFFIRLGDGTNSMGTLVDFASVPSTGQYALNANVASFPVPTTSSTVAFGAAPYTTNATSTSTYTNVKSSTGNVYGFDYYNPNTSVCWLQFYNATAPTVGTSVLFAEPLYSNTTNGGGHIVLPFPVNFATAISIATTTTATGSTECSTGIGLTLYYQ